MKITLLQKVILHYGSGSQPFSSRDPIWKYDISSRPHSFKKMTYRIFRLISRGQFLALKMSFSILPPNKPNQKISLRNYRYLFSFCNKVCQVCVTFITHQRMFFIMEHVLYKSLRSSYEASPVRALGARLW